MRRLCEPQHKKYIRWVLPVPAHVQMCELPSTWRLGLQPGARRGRAVNPGCDTAAADGVILGIGVRSLYSLRGLMKQSWEELSTIPAQADTFTNQDPSSTFQGIFNMVYLGLSGNRTGSTMPLRPTIRQTFGIYFLAKNSMRIEWTSCLILEMPQNTGLIVWRMQHTTRIYWT